jgi:hypothetical protein
MRGRGLHIPVPVAVFFRRGESWFVSFSESGGIHEIELVPSVLADLMLSCPELGALEPDRGALILRRGPKGDTQLEFVDTRRAA